MPGTSGIRMLEPVGGGKRASCAAGEIMIGAYCIGTYVSYPLQVGNNEAWCSAGAGSDVKVVVICGKQ